MDSGYNHAVVLANWAYNTLRKSNLTLDEREQLFYIAKKEINVGGFRGDICAKWELLGYGSDVIDDFYSE